MKRVVTILTLIVLVVGGIMLVMRGVSSRAENAKTRIRTDTSEIRDIEAYVTASGEVLPLMSSIVKSEISGRLSNLYVREGDEVEKGQLLLELDRTSLEARVRESQRSLEADRLRLEKAERNFERLKELYQKQFVGEKEYLDAETDYNLAKLNLEIGQARLEDAEEDLAKTSISAPHDGIITKMDIVDGQVISGATSVSNGTELMTISQLKDLYLESNINEVDVDNLSEGDKARLRFDAMPNFQLLGRIEEIALSARRDGNIRVFPIKVVFEAGGSGVRPGISAKVEIPIEKVEGVVSVLLSAVFNEDEESIVFVKKETGWERRVVEVGINDLQYLQIKSGLEAGEVVALNRPPEFRGSNE